VSHPRVAPLQCGPLCVALCPRSVYLCWTPTCDCFRAMTASRSRPMEKSRALACFHDLLHKVGGVPEDKLRLYGLSSLRKFLPNVGRANKLDNARSSPSAAPFGMEFFFSKNKEKAPAFGMRGSAALLLACAVQSSCGCMGDSLHDGNAMQPWHRTAS